MAGTEKEFKTGKPGFIIKKCLHFLLSVTVSFVVLYVLMLSCMKISELITYNQKLVLVQFTRMFFLPSFLTGLIVCKIKGLYRPVLASIVATIIGVKFFHDAYILIGVMVKGVKAYLNISNPLAVNPVEFFPVMIVSLTCLLLGWVVGTIKLKNTSKNYVSTTN